MNLLENQWVEVFRAGKQTDSSGRKREWNTSDLEEIVNTYNKEKHEAPVVIGHPKDNAPAFGWVESLKTDGKVLFAKFKQLVPEFIEAVKTGMYKKRSISLYPDLTLRHIGFLGAVPPAVKGLADIKFNEKDSYIIELDYSEKEENSMHNTAKETDVESLKAQLQAEKQKNKRMEFNEYVTRLHNKGKLVSGLQDDVVKLMEVMSNVGEHSFSEGKISVLAKFKDYLEKQPKIVEFKEVANDDIVRISDAAEQLNALTVEKVELEHISYTEALDCVQKEFPDLARKAAQEL